MRAKILFLCGFATLLIGCSSKSHQPEAILPVAAQGHHPSKDHHSQVFKSAKEWAKEFDDPGRDAWQQPAVVLKMLRLKPADHVVDLGAGTGYFAVKIAPVIPRGIIYAVDIEADMVRYVEVRAGQLGLQNIKPILADEAGFEVASKIDLLLVVDTYHHIGDRTLYFKSLIPKLNKQGRLVIIDFLATSPFGPPPAHRYQPPQIKKEMEAAGYKFVREVKLPYQFFLEFSL